MYQLKAEGTLSKQHYLGDALDLSGLTLTAEWSDGRTENVALNNPELKITGYNPNTRGTQIVTLTYNSARVEIKVPVLRQPSSDPSASNEITVYFTLLGDVKHDTDEDGHGIPTANGGPHGLAKHNLETWIARTSYTVDLNATVRDVFETALTENGLTWSNPSGNYIESITYDGVELAEFTNGPDSGWMYTLNNKRSGSDGDGLHPMLGVSEQYLEDGDRIIFHYTDDWHLEDGSENLSNPSSSGTTTVKKDETDVTTELKPEATADANGEATATVTSEDLSSTIAQAKADKADTIVIAPEVKGEASKVSVELPKSGVDDIAKQTDAALKVETGIADITIPQQSLNDLAGQSGSRVTVSAETVKDTKNIKIEVAVDGKAVEKLAGGIGVSVPSKGENSSNVLVIVNADGSETVVKKSVVNGKAVAAVLDGSCTVKIMDNSKNFADTENHWSKEAVAFASSHELFNGVAEDAFAPDAAMSRAMLATVLYRLEDAAASGVNPFADVADGTWYTDAVVWASAENIVSGTGDGFEPDRDITRQELVTMLYRYAKSAGLDTGKTAKLDGYTDSGDVADWAGDAMSWAVGNGLVSGCTSTTLAPTGTATRAEVAAVMQRLVALMVK